MFVIIINLSTLNNLKYYNGSNIHLLENVKLFCGKQPGFGYQAELITAQLRAKKTYFEIKVNPYLKSSETTKAFNPKNILSVIRSIMLIFFNQIIYVIKKILRIN